MNRTQCILLLMLTTLFLTGFFWGKSKVDTIQGIWKCETPSDKGYISFLEIGKDYIILDDYEGFREDGLIIEEKEGVVLIRKAGMNEVLARIVIRDDDHIISEFPGRKLSFVRSSKEEKQNIFTPPVKNIAGFYQGQDGTMLFEFSESDVVRNGVSLDLSLVGEDQMYFAVNGNSIRFTLTPAENGTLLYREQPGTPPITLFKIAPEAAAAILENKAAEANWALSNGRVELNNLSATVPGPGGTSRMLNLNMILEMHYLPEEQRPGAMRPTAAQLETFRTAVVQLEGKIRDHMNTFITGQSYTNLMGDRGPELVKAEVKRYVHKELEKIDFEAFKIPADISKRRITNVLLPLWMLK